MANESCGKVPWNTKLKTLECFVWNVFSSRGNLPTWNPHIRLPICQGEGIITSWTSSSTFSSHGVIICHAWVVSERLPICIILSQTLGIWKLTYFDSSPILWTWNWTILRCLKTWVVAIVFKMVVKTLWNGDVIKTNYE
jgi:hypothetical protein